MSLPVWVLCAQLATGFIAVAGESSTITPVERTDDASRFAHQSLVEKATRGGIDIYFVGDSITRRWGASDRFSNEQIRQNWITNFSGWKVANFGWGGDTVENILWRLANGELEGVNPKVIVVLAGINNVGSEIGRPDKAAHIAKGIRAILDVCREKAPNATVVITAIFPRNDNMAVIPVINEANRQIARLADGRKVRFIDINSSISDANGKFLPGMVGRDQLHPAVATYQIWAEALKPIFTEIVGPPAQPERIPASAEKR